MKEGENIIRREGPGDIPGVRSLNEKAFGQPDEAALVDTLRENGRASISLVAVSGERVVGHILFSPMTLEEGGETKALGLAPMAVMPELQRRGIGSRLVEAGLEDCRNMGYVAVFVLGHAGYYPRFGFVPASRFGIRCAYDAPDEAFMALELSPGALKSVRGRVLYAPEFDGL